MTARAVRVSSVISFALVSAFAVPAFAHDPRVAVDVDGGSCVAHEGFRQEVEARGGRVDDDASVRLRVRMLPHEGGSSVAVDVSGEGPRGALASRTFVAVSCAEAVDAAALLVALSGVEASNPEPTPEPPSPPPAIDAPAPPSPRVSERSSTTSLYASGAIVGTSLGEGQIGGRLALGLAAERAWLPWIEAAASANVPRSISGGGGEATLTWISGRVAVSPIGIALAPSLFASAYAGAEAGALFASGDGTSRVDSRTRPWLAALAGARLRWDVGSRIFAGADAGAALPLLRDEFVFVHGGTAYRTPIVAFETALSLGTRFP